MVDHVSTQSVTASTLPDGTQIAVDQLLTGELVQIVKLYDGADNSSNAASVSAAGALKVDGSAVTQPVSAASLPLPSGASTGAKQDTGNTSVASIDTKTPALGQALAGASVPVVLPSATVTTLTPPPAITGFALEAGHLAAIDTHLDVALSTRTKPSDQQHVIIDSSASLGVTGPLTDTQLRATPVPVSNASLPLPSGAATDASLVTLDTDLKAEIGTVGTIPGAYTVLDRLAQNGRKLDALTNSVATEPTLKKLLAALSKPVQPAYSTLLHR